MAKKSMKDVLPNRKYVTVTWAPATTTTVLTVVDTMMGARERSGWLISRVDVQSRGMLDGWAASSNGVRFQLATGAQTDLIAKDNNNHICTIDVQTVFATNGMSQLVFPLTWVGPVLVASNDLTCLMKGTDDAAPLQSHPMIFTIWYRWVTMTDREWIELFNATGQ